MKYVVTGGAGFIGSNIVKLLVKNGHISMDDFIKYDRPDWGFLYGADLLRED